MQGRRFEGLDTRDLGRRDIVSLNKAFEVHMFADVVWLKLLEGFLRPDGTKELP